MATTDIDEVFLRSRKKDATAALLLLVLLFAFFAYIFLANSGEILAVLPYIPQVLPTKILPFMGMGMGIAAILGGWIAYRRLEIRATQAHLRLLGEATVVLHTATPRQVVVPYLSMFYISLSSPDAPDDAPPRVLGLLQPQQPIRKRDPHASAEWFADPAHTVEVIRFSDGTAVPAMPVRHDPEAVPPPPRAISPLVRLYFSLGGGFLVMGLAMSLALALVGASTSFPIALHNMVYRSIPSRVTTGQILRVEPPQGDCGPQLVYQYGNSPQRMVHVSEAVAKRFPPGTPITVEYLRDFPNNAWIREIPHNGDPTGAVMMGVLAILVAAGAIVVTRQSRNELQIIRTYAFDWMTVAAIPPGGMARLRSTANISLRDAAGEIRTVPMRSVTPSELFPGLQIPVFVNPENPTQLKSLSTMMSQLPVRFSPDGTLQIPLFYLLSMFLTMGLTAVILAVPISVFLTGG